MSVKSRLERGVAPFRRGLPTVNDTFGTLLTLPSMIYVLLLAGFPVLYLAYISVTQNVFSIVDPTEFVGLENYVRVLSSGSFWLYFANTLVYALLSIFGGLVLQLGIALVLDTDLPFKRGWQTLILLPWAVPHVISAQIWRMLFNPTFGAINWVLLELGVISEAINWFSGKWVAFTTIIVTDIWIRTPLVVLILLAGLQTIPDEYYEAARMDGAGIWDRFRHVTLPQLKNALIVALVIRTILALRAFELIYALTTGGPGNATTVVGLDIWQQLMKFTEPGYAAAEAMILVTVIYALIGLAVHLFPNVDMGEAT